MKHISPLYCLLLLLVLGACNPNGNAPASETAPDSTSLKNTVIIDGDTIKTNVVQPIVVEKATKEGAAKRAGASIVAKEECCSSHETVKSCCCDKVVDQYRSALKKGNYSGASELKSKDPFYKSCRDQIPGFEKRIMREDTLAGLYD